MVVVYPLSFVIRPLSSEMKKGPNYLSGPDAPGLKICNFKNVPRFMSPSCKEDLGMEMGYLPLQLYGPPTMQKGHREMGSPITSPTQPKVH